MLASPKARRLAAAAKIDLNAVTGSGPEKAILAEDILKLSAERQAHRIPEYTTIPVTGTRRTIAEKLQRSAREAPHISLCLSVDMTRAMKQLKVWNASQQARAEELPSTTSLICKAIVISLQQHPRLNSHFMGDEIREYHSVHLGIAVALRDGLVVPVIRNAEAESLKGLHSKLTDLVRRARQGALQPHEIKGSTFTLTSLGMFGIEQFTAILNPPEVGILSVGTILETPIGLNGQITLRSMMQATINADHRAVDGAVAARFLGTLKQTLENAEQLVV